VSLRRRVLQVVAAAAGIAAAGTAVQVARQRRVIARRGIGDAAKLGSLHSTPLIVVAADGVPLHVEVDEADGALTVVFVHGFALNLDCWHFQRAGYRGLVRTVFYDQRSHGRSGRSQPGNSTIDQLGADLRQVLDQVVPDGPVVLVGHSMGGMAILALAEAHPELFGERIVGAGLISTSAGGINPVRILVPLIPEGVGGEVAHRIVAGLARTSRVVEGIRRISKDVAMVVTDMFAFGDKVPPEYVEFVDDMLSRTHFEVLAEFFPQFDALDKFAVVNAFERIPTTIICGTADKLTGIGHSRKLHSVIARSTLLECEGAGHMVVIERHEQVNAALDQLLAAAAAHAPSGPESGL
jgi:pimeloyl-ACP methyl ester carboxylesterase